ncbi:MAG: hypothetical protein IJ973_01795, partial [Christensenellaceae bacterium]|nr:hypothetical protein [Christensenellaceae bacterium]
MLYTNKEEFKSEYLLEFNRLMGKSIEESSLGEKYRALVNLLREKISVDWVDTSKLYTQKGEKEVFYFSLEFLIGRLLPYYLINLGVEDIVKAGLKDLGINIEDIYQPTDKQVSDAWHTGELWVTYPYVFTKTE